MSGSSRFLFRIRCATGLDGRKILGIDHVAAKDVARRKAIGSALRERAVFVAVEKEHVLGFAVLRSSFFGRPFVELLYVRAERRRVGVGGALLSHLEARVSRHGDEIWTSSNQSNEPMRRLLAVKGYLVAGRVTGLDAGDPELFYVKKGFRTRGRE